MRLETQEKFPVQFPPGAASWSEQWLEHRAPGGDTTLEIRGNTRKRPRGADGERLSDLDGGLQPRPGGCDHSRPAAREGRSLRPISHSAPRLGGVGKTSSRWNKHTGFMADYDLVWWMPSERAEQISLALAELARKMGLQVGDNAAEAALEDLHDDSSLRLAASLRQRRRPQAFRGRRLHQGGERRAPAAPRAQARAGGGLPARPRPAQFSHASSFGSSHASQPVNGASHLGLAGERVRMFLPGG